MAVGAISGHGDCRVLGGGGGGSIGGTGGGIGILYSLVLLVEALLSAKSQDNSLTDTGTQTDAKAITASQPSERIYSVYFLCKLDDKSKTIVYVGRVKTANFTARMHYHDKKGRELVKSINNLTYEECRAIEQGGMMYHHSINKDESIHNQIRGISPYNPNLPSYWNAIYNLINSKACPENALLPVSYWENLTEEAFLNGGLLIGGDAHEDIRFSADF